MKHWKKYNESKKLVDSTQIYKLNDAIELIKKTSKTKFDSTVELVVKTFANPKFNDQMMRWTTILPHWTWKTKKIAVFVWEDKAADAKKAWADIAWTEVILKNIKEWKFDFDILITTADLIRDLAPVAKQLWPKWLMPSPKAWTVVTDIWQAVEEIKKWKIEFKIDKTGCIHTPVGKVSFDTNKIEENITSFIKALEDSKPSWVKGKLIKKVVISSTMGPWIQIEA